MTHNNVIQLFTAAAAISPDSSSSKPEPISYPMGEALLAKLSALNLDTLHPATGLKYRGFMPLSCIIFAPELFHILSSGQFKLLMYLTFLKFRYPEKSGYVRGALPYLSLGTGISRSTIHEYLIYLESLKLIECMEVNQKLGNLYRIADLVLWNPTQENKPSEVQPPTVQQSGIQTTENQTTENQTAEIRTTPVQNSDCSSPKISPPQSENWTEDYTSLDFSKLSNSLSQHDGFKTRWKTFPKKAATREKSLIKALLEKNSNDLNEIYETLVELETTGKTYGGQPCHSPVGLISSSWPAIKRIRSSRKADSAKQTPPKVDSTALKEREALLQEMRQYVSSLKPTEANELHQVVESEIRKARPNIGEIWQDTRIYQSFLEMIVAARLGRERPGSN